MALVLSSISGIAQVKVGDTAPDFNLLDINGNPQHLYSYLDSGYTVIIDVSAAWCGPCWEAHQGKVFDKLTSQYGKNGSVSPGKVKVLFIEGESANTTAQLYGTNTNSSHSGSTAGNWVAGTNYPIIDNSSLNSSYLYGGFPSFTVICRDRLVMNVETGWNIYGAKDSVSYWMSTINKQCPAYAPSTTLDAKAVVYNGPDYFLCKATPTVQFQNYSLTSTITAATIKVYSGASVVATVPWTGSLPPYGIAKVPVPSFSGTGFPYKFDVTVPGDSRASNNVSSDSIYKVYAAPNALSMPWSENFERQTNNAIPYRMTALSNEYVSLHSEYGPIPLVDKSGNKTRSMQLLLSFLTTGASTGLFLGNFNTTSASKVFLEFDYTYQQMVAADNDKLAIQVSNDCGLNWTNAWSKSGSTLATVPPNGSSYSLAPYEDSVWKHASVDLSAYKGQNMLVKLVGTSGPSQNSWGRDIWIDNFRLSSSLGTAPLIADNSLSIYPNPSRQQAYLDFYLKEKTELTINIIDITGRVVSKVPGENLTPGQQHISISTASLVPGIYQVVVQTSAGTLSRSLAVIK
jgi:hypothetical protein